MRAWFYFLHLVHDYIAVILVAAVVLVFVAVWMVLEALRSQGGKDEVFRLRQRLYQLEREKNFVNLENGPVVLTSRWVPVGGAATTSDGGCLLLVEAASPVQKRIKMTVRVDGLPVKTGATMTVGQRVRVDGKSGAYSIEVFGAEKHQVRLGVSLRSRHLEEQEPEASEA